MRFNVQVVPLGRSHLTGMVIVGKVYRLLEKSHPNILLKPRPND